MVNPEQTRDEKYSVDKFLDKGAEVFENDYPFLTLVGMINTFHRITEENGIKPSEVGPNYAIYNSYKRVNLEIVRETEVITPKSNTWVQMVDFNGANARGIRRYATEAKHDEVVFPCKQETGNIYADVEQMQAYLQMMQEIVSDSVGD
jgi:hypothetical protein